MSRIAKAFVPMAVEVSIRYHKDRPRQGMSALTEDEIHEIAWRLIRAGLKPTIEAVRIVKGGGSATTINPALTSFFDGELERRWGKPDRSTVPAPLEMIWSTALKEAKRECFESLKDRVKEVEIREGELNELSSKSKVKSMQTAITCRDEALHATQAKLEWAEGNLRRVEEELRRSELRLSQEENRTVDTQARLALHEETTGLLFATRQELSKANEELVSLLARISAASQNESKLISEIAALKSMLNQRDGGSYQR